MQNLKFFLNTLFLNIHLATTSYSVLQVLWFLTGEAHTAPN